MSFVEEILTEDELSGLLIEKLCIIEVERNYFECCTYKEFFSNVKKAFKVTDSETDKGVFKYFWDNYTQVLVDMKRQETTEEIFIKDNDYHSL